MVPQLAIEMAMKRMVQSIHRAPLSRICAEMGPIIHIVKALKEPRNAMTAENSGTAIENATAVAAVTERLNTLTRKLRELSVVPEPAL